jgi:hypothetical protein
MYGELQLDNDANSPCAQLFSQFTRHLLQIINRIALFESKSFLHHQIACYFFCEILDPTF